MRCVFLLGFVATSVLAGCSSSATAPPRPPIAPIARAPAPPSYRGERVPLSLQRLVSEQKTELEDVRALASVVGDARGRVRATSEASSLVTELLQIEGSLAGADSEGFDRSALELLQLERRIGLLHDALRAAAPDLGSPKEIDR